MDGHATQGRGGTLTGRRRVLSAVGTATLAGVAGCGGLLPGSDGGDGTDVEPGLIGSARADRGLPGGTPMAELPPLSGELTVYSGRGEFLVGELVGAIEDRNPDLDLGVRYGGATELANQIRTEGDASPADVFFTVNAGVLGLLANEGLTRTLPDEVLDMGRERYQDPDGQWVGTSGRVRTIPYNTEVFDAEEIPDDIGAFPEEERFADAMGWAPTYSSFQGFVTAMRIIDGDDAARSWLEGMVEQNVTEFDNEFRVAQAVADGEIDAGFTNHYYVLRVLDARPDAPLDMAFTRNDAGAFFNVAGAAVVNTAADPDLAANFVRHLLSAEAQDYFARSRTFEYPMIPEVEPLDRLPDFDELDPPDLDLEAFADTDVNETVELMEAAGVL